MGVTRRKKFLLIIVGLFLCLFVGLSPANCRPAKLQVAASILPLADFCREIGGDKVEVQVLIPPGASPHVFEPSPRLLANLANAKVLVFVGAGLEPWLDKFMQTWQDKKPVVVEATQGIELITEIPGHAGEAVSPIKSQMQEAGHTHEHGSGNPHIWLDPILVQDTCRRIAAAFIKVDPDNKATYEKNLEHYLDKLAQLNKEILAATDTFRLREFVGFHPSFTYFARRYHLKEVGIIEVAPGREPTPRALQNIMGAIQRYGIKVIFSEPQFSPRIAEVLAKEAGVSVLQLDPIGGRPPYNDNYIKMMQYNLSALAKAMR
jgi:zinc transport system substrate-binding protein